MKDVSYSILEEIRTTLRQVDERALFCLADEITEAERIFFVGTGRCDLIMRSFAMRLTQLGQTCFVVRDVTTPAIGHDDLLIICSLTTDSKWLAEISRRSRASGARVYVITPQRTTPLTETASSCMLIPKVLSPTGLPSTQPGSVIFEQCCFMITETVITHLGSRISRTNEALMKFKSNLE